MRAGRRAHGVRIEEGDQVELLGRLAHRSTQRRNTGLKIGNLAVELVDLRLKSGDFLALFRI